MHAQIEAMERQKKETRAYSYGMSRGGCAMCMRAFGDVYMYVSGVNISPLGCEIKSNQFFLHFACMSVMTILLN